VSAESSVPPTIYDWGGGREAFERWINVFYDLVEQDELLSALFGGSVGDEHRRRAHRLRRLTAAQAVKRLQQEVGMSRAARLRSRLRLPGSP
jgi:truncated hemoglobin YjbI